MIFILFRLIWKIISSPFVLLKTEKRSYLNHYIQFPLKLLNHFKVNIENQIKKCQNIIARTAILNDGHFTDKDDPFEKKIQQNNHPFPQIYH